LKKSEESASGMMSKGDLALTVGGIGLGFLALGCTLLNWAYSVYTAPNSSIVFAVLLTIAGLSFIVTGIGGLRLLAKQVFPVKESSDSETLPVKVASTTLSLLQVLQAIGLALFIASLMSYAMLYQTAPRALEPETARQITERLREVTPPGANVQIVRDEDDTCRRIADQYSKIFDSAGLHQVSKPRAPGNNERLFRGVSVVHSPSDTGASLALRSVLHGEKVDYQSVPDFDLYGRGFFLVTISSNWAWFNPSEMPTP
jgi:hypothetical protein